MGFGEILLLALGLAMDATAVSAARGLSVDAVHPRHMLLVALYFGGSQALMPLLGWALGAWLGPWLEAWDHWIAFVLLAFIGGKMLWEAWGDREGEGGGEGDGEDGGEAEPERDPFGWKLMLLLAIATSIDALAVGFTLPMLGAPFALSLVTIGVTTAL
ncbi:MAG: manganese efflux pump, partial [Myxococcales bacterium]|nr:manganese efflux pump [Myxococcales bacterium]